MKKLSLALLFTLVISCGKAPSDSNPAYGKYAETLTGKSNEEILKLKYGNKIDLKCAVRVQDGRIVRMSAKPVEEMVWQLTSELSLLRVLNFKVGNKETIIVIRLSKPLNFLQSLNHTAENRREYYMEHTPVQKILYRRASKKILSDGSVHERGTFFEHTLYENVESRLYTMTTFEDNRPVTEDVRCTLLTNINPQYSNQWQIIR